MLIFILLYQATFSAMKLATRGHQHCSGKTKTKRQKKAKMGKQRNKQEFVYKLYSCKSTGEQVPGRRHPARAPSSSGGHSREEEIPQPQKELSCSCWPCPEIPLLRVPVERLPHLCCARCPEPPSALASPSAQGGFLT